MLVSKKNDNIRRHCHSLLPAGGGPMANELKKKPSRRNGTASTIACHIKILTS